LNGANHSKSTEVVPAKIGSFSGRLLLIDESFRFGFLSAFFETIFCDGT
jgi:hypothetical protein